MGVALAALILSPAVAGAQTAHTTPGHVYPAPPALDVRTEATDEAAIAALTARVYAAISGPAGPRDWDAVRALFVPEARLVPVGAKGPLVLDVQGYIDRAGPMMARQGFYESEVARRVERYGNIAHVFSTYESRHAPGDRPFARGINSIQLVSTPGGWRVLHIVWQGETPMMPIPARYLPVPGKK